MQNLKFNAMGTASFTAKFKGMRKEQEFVVYPMQGGDSRERVKIQSDTRIGYIYNDGRVQLSAPRAGGAYFVHLINAVFVDNLTAEELAAFKAKVNMSAKVVETVCRTDNTSAMHF